VKEKYKLNLVLKSLRLHQFSTSCLRISSGWNWPVQLPGFTYQH